MTPETERRFVGLALEEGAVSEDAIRRLEHARDLDSAGARRRRSLARMLCDEGLLERPVALRLLREARARIQGLPSDGLLPDATPSLAERGPIRAAGRIVLAPGVVLGPYEIEDELGEGGMGVVFRARDRRLGRTVALKTISGRADETAVARFLREGRAAARLRHPGIVTVYGAERIEGIRVVALELVEGQTLAQKLARDGPLPPQQAAALVRALALAVHAAHEGGVIHRDLKPSNVLLEEDGRPRLTDFGLAKDEQEASLTASNEVLGTPMYMAPEQALGADEAVSARTDVYGLGAILHECLAGVPPFAGKKKLALARAIVEEEPERPTRLRVARGLGPVPSDLETICRKALAKSPAERFPTAEQMAEDLGRFVDGRAIHARPATLRARAARWLWRHRRLSVAAVFVVGMLLVQLVKLEQARARAARIDHLVQKGQRHALAGEHARALACLDAAIAADPSDFRSWKRRAEEHVRNGELEPARADYTRAIQLSGEPASFAARGSVALRLDDPASALRDLERAQALAPDDDYLPALAAARAGTKVR